MAQFSGIVKCDDADRDDGRRVESTRPAQGTSGDASRPSTLAPGRPVVPVGPPARRPTRAAPRRRGAPGDPEVRPATTFVDRLPVRPAGERRVQPTTTTSTASTRLPILPARSPRSEREQDRASSLTRTSAVTTETRKLFLPAHQRYYLVALELHCDAAGLPVGRRRDQIARPASCVRRRVTDVPAARSRGGDHAGRPDRRPGRGAQRSAAARRGPRLDRGACVPVLTQAGACESVDAARRRRCRRQREGSSCQAPAGDVVGRPAGVDRGRGLGAESTGNVGGWAPVDGRARRADRGDGLPDVPAGIPTRPTPDHAARVGTIFFGLVPTRSAEIDAGRARRASTTSTSTRSAASFAARPTADEPLPWRSWSGASRTEPFRLASPFDPVGCGQRPVNDPAARPRRAGSARRPARACGCRRAAELASRCSPTGHGAAGGRQRSARAEEICFFAIPLITIVAMLRAQPVPADRDLRLRAVVDAQAQVLHPAVDRAGRRASTAELLGDSRSAPGDGGHRRRRPSPESTRRSSADGCGAASDADATGLGDTTTAGSRTTRSSRP